jgi:hypothetical protein
MPLEPIRNYYRLQPRNIAFLRFALEACDGLGFVRTVRAGDGLVAIHAPGGRRPELEALIDGLRESFAVEPVPAAAGIGEEPPVPRDEPGRRPPGGST